MELRYYEAENMMIELQPQLSQNQPILQKTDINLSDGLQILQMWHEMWRIKLHIRKIDDEDQVDDEWKKMSVQMETSLQVTMMESAINQIQILSQNIDQLRKSLICTNEPTTTD